MPARAKSLAFARAVAGLIRLDLAPPPRRLSWAILLAALAAPGAALAQAQCAPTTQPPTLCSDQVNLLSPFASLLNSPAGLAVLEANMQTEEAIYAGASAARRTLAAENALINYAPQSILIGAFPNNPNFYFSAAGIPTAPTLPTPVTAAVTFRNRQHGYRRRHRRPEELLRPDRRLRRRVRTPRRPTPTAIRGLFRRRARSPTILSRRPIPRSSPIRFSRRTTATSRTGRAMSSPPPFRADIRRSATSMRSYSPSWRPDTYQQLLQSGVDFGYSRNVFGAHYPLDVIGGRILATYVTAETLAGDNPLYPSAELHSGQSPLAQRRRCRPISPLAAAALRPTRRRAPTSPRASAMERSPLRRLTRRRRRTTPIT